MSTEVVDPTKQVDPLKAFEEKVINKIKTDIGAMLPDEVLYGLAKKAVDEQFFKDRVIKTGYYNETRTEPSNFVKAVIEAARPMLTELVKKFVEENQDVLRKGLEEFLTKESLLLILMAQLREESASSMRELVNEVEQLKKKVGSDS